MFNVIIPIYNSRKTLPNTLNSLVAQTQQRFLVTIVDDASTENCDDIINEYKSKLRISYIKLKTNVGPGMARQAGLDANLICEPVMFLDSDDMLMPQAIEVLNREFNLKKPDMLISSFVCQRKYKNDIIKDYKDNLTWIHGKVYSNSFLKDNNIRFPTNIRVNEDGCFNTIVSNMTDNIYVIPTITVLWVDNKDSMTRKDDEFYLNSIPDFIRGQSYAFDFLAEKNRIKESKEQLAKTIAYIYNYYQFFQYYDGKSEEDLFENFTNLLSKEEIKNLFLSDEYFLDNLLKGLMDKNTKNLRYFETETFSDFISKFGIKIGDFNESNFD